MRVSRQELLQRLELGVAGLATREIVEQSSCFVFRGGWLYSYNEEILTRQPCPIEFKAAVSGQKLLDTLSKMPEEYIDVELNKDKGEIIIKGQGRRSGIKMWPEILLPIDNIEEPAEWIKLDDNFNDAVEVVQRCAGKDEQEKFVLSCVHMAPRFLEACDNLQAARFPVATGLQRNCLVRRSALKSIVGLGMTEIGETQKWLHFRNPAGLIISTRRYKESYIPLDSTFEVEGQAATLPPGLAEAVDRCQVHTAENKDNELVRVALRPGKLRVKGEGSLGWFEEEKPVDYNGPEIAFMINPKLLTEITRQHNNCVMSDSKMKVDCGRFVYIALLAAPTA